MIRSVMHGFRRSAWILLFVVGLLAALFLDLTGCVSRPVAAPSRPSDALVEDAALIKGTLGNGLTYYVRRNQAPPALAELRLVVNAGSLQENDDQRGLAHFCEHMAFRGSRSFPRNAMVDWLESLGNQFGPDVNGVTTFDETVFRFQIPTDDPAVIDRAILALDEMAEHLSFDPDQVRKEASVIAAERLRDAGAESRMRDAQIPALYGAPAYAARPPLGSATIVQHASPQDLRRFYRAWYRPDLMAVVAVGDFDATRVVALIRDRFGAFRTPAGAPSRLRCPSPDSPGTIYAPATDPEATSTRVTIYIRHAPRALRTPADDRQGLVEELFNRMLSTRLEEIAREPDTPLEAGASACIRPVRSVDAYVLASRVKGDRIRDALQTLTEEALRAERFGFTEQELDTQKKALLARLQESFEQRDSRPSASLAQSFVEAFLRGEVAMDAGMELTLAREFIPTIGLADVSEAAARLLAQNNRIVLVNAPSRAAAAVPTEPDVQAILSRLSAASSVSAPAPRPAAGGLPAPPLFRQHLEEVGVRSDEDLPALDVRRWTLANGAVVVCKPTSFVPGEVLFGAFRAGGASRVADAQYVAELTAAEAISEAGVGAFTAGALRQALLGTGVQVTPWIGDYGEGLKGQAGSAALEKLFQLIYLTLTAPRRDAAAFETWKERTASRILNRGSSPTAAFFDSVRSTLFRDAFRCLPWTSEEVSALNLDTSFRLYQEAFSSPASFKFFFVGDLAPEQVEGLARKYLGALPAGGSSRSWVDTGVRALTGNHDSELRTGREPRSRVEIVYSGPLPWSLDNLARLEALAQVLESRLRGAIRREAGGSYDVAIADQITIVPDQEYYLYESFSCAPDRAAELARIARAETQRLCDQGADPDVVSAVRQMLRKDHEQDVRTNEFWLTALQTAEANGIDLMSLRQFDARMASITVERVSADARHLLRPDNVLQVIQYPELPAGAPR